MDLTILIIGSLATFRLAYMLTNEAGPLNIFDRLRLRFRENGKGRIGDALGCIYCTSVYVAGFWTLFYVLFPRVAVWCMVWFALSTVAIMITMWGDW